MPGGQGPTDLCHRGLIAERHGRITISPTGGELSAGSRNEDGLSPATGRFRPGGVSRHGEGSPCIPAPSQPEELELLIDMQWHYGSLVPILVTVVSWLAECRYLQALVLGHTAQSDSQPSSRSIFLEVIVLELELPIRCRAPSPSPPRSRA